MQHKKGHANAIKHYPPLRVAGIQRREKLLLFDRIGESFILDRIFKLGLAKEVAFRHTEMRKIDIPEGRNNIIKDTETEKTCTHVEMKE